LAGRARTLRELAVSRLSSPFPRKQPFNRFSEFLMDLQ
jgi:hypothetical protein